MKAAPLGTFSDCLIPWGNPRPGSHYSPNRRSYQWVSALRALSCVVPPNSTESDGSEGGTGDFANSFHMGKEQNTCYYLTGDAVRARTVTCCQSGALRDWFA